MRIAWHTLGCVVAAGLLAACSGASDEDRATRSRLLGHVRVLASDLGPRPTGSPAEQRARQYILESMRESGLAAQEDPLREVRIGKSTDLILDSANVVGRLEGEHPGAILVGAHHDSRCASCPGASDDASGVAVVLETARRWAKRSHRHTLVFASFTGEETLGLPGSSEFLRRWNGPPLVAALTLDFVGSGKLFVAPFPRPPELWASRLVAQAEARVGTRRVSFDPWLVTVPRMLAIPYGADHASFLEAGIPALNLSCQFPAWTYHTREDLPERVEGETLAASVDLVSGMLEILDRGREDLDRRDDGYVPVATSRSAFFIPGAILKSLGPAVLLLGIIVVMVRRREVFHAAAWGEAIRALLLSVPFTLLGISGGFGADFALGMLRGVRHPSAQHPGAHLAGALVASSLTLWIAMGLFRFLRPATRPGPYLAVGALLLVGEAAGLMYLGRHDIAFPLWTSVAGMLLGSFSTSAIRRVAWGMLGGIWLLPYLSPVTYRMFLELSGVSLPPFALAAAALALSLPWFLFAQHLTCLPEVLLAGKPGRFWSAPVGGVLAILAIGCLAFNALRPAYDDRHRALVQVREDVDLTRQSAQANLTSLETLSPVRLQGWDSQSLGDDGEEAIVIPWDRLEPPDLFLETEALETESAVRLRGSLPGSPRLVSLRLRSTSAFQVWRSGSWEELRDYRVVWAPVAREIAQEVLLRQGGDAPVEVEAEVQLDDDVLGLRPRASTRAFRFSSRVRLSARIAPASPQAPGAASRGSVILPSHVASSAPGPGIPSRQFGKSLEFRP